jgi:hypothetical protein
VRRALLVVTAFALMAGTAEAKDLKPAQIVARLNAERAQLGMAPVKLSSKYTKGCRLHNTWQKLNNTLAHSETKGTRGYTALGDKTASLSVLAFGEGGWRKGNPWRNGPFHLMFVYNPRLRTVGAYDSYNRSCLETEAGVAAPAKTGADRFWTLPGDGGTIPYAQRALESPHLPQELAGISAKATTGPNIAVWADAMDPAYPFNRVFSASLVEAGGIPVAAGTVDHDHSRGSLAAGQALVIPLLPLKPQTDYRATVVMATTDGRKATHSWSFTTTRVTLPY